LTSGQFKDRNFSFRHKKASKSIELSKYVWELKNNEIELTLTWKIVDRAMSYKNG